jgi:hypothetical protein
MNEMQTYHCNKSNRERYVSTQWWLFEGGEAAHPARARRSRLAPWIEAVRVLLELGLQLTAHPCLGARLHKHVEVVEVFGDEPVRSLARVEREEDLLDGRVASSADGSGEWCRTHG